MECGICGSYRHNTSDCPKPAEWRIITDQKDKVINDAEALCTKFIQKVETGKARSTETYKECKELLEEIKVYRKVLEQYG